jgi:flagellar hook-basal body complex protein FliE
MEINTLSRGLAGINTNQNHKTSKPGFDNVFTELVKNVNQAQAESNKLTSDFIAGGDVELHEVMIAGEKAKTSLDLLIEIRNKTIDMYKELTRIQV